MLATHSSKPYKVIIKMYNIHNIYFKNIRRSNMFGLVAESFSIGTTIITILNILLVILVVYIIKLISNHFSKVKQLEKDVDELKNERCNNENQNKK